MFGGPLELPKKTKQQPWPGRLPDILLPCPAPNRYGHSGRQPNSNYSVRMLHYRQRLKETFEKMNLKFRNKELADKIFVQYFHHVNRKVLQKDIKQRVDAKLKAADEALEVRRQKLTELLGQEERQFYYETVDQAQRGQETKMQQMKEKAQMIQAKRETERLKLVEKKRLQQYREQNELLMPVLDKLHNVESKMVNLQQMRENEAKREAERETDLFYHHVVIKDMIEKMRREEQDAVKAGNDMREMVNTWDQQIRGKEILREEEEAAKIEDRESLERNIAEMRQDVQGERMIDFNKKQLRKQDLANQIALRQQFLAQRQKEDDSLDRAFARLNELALAKEMADTSEARMQAKREAMTYRKYVNDLKREREEEDKLTEKILDAHQREILRKQEIEKCKIIRAKTKLREEVFAIRAGQLEEKKLTKQREMEEKMKEVELYEKIQEMNQCLYKEEERLKKEEVLNHRDDLLKQIEYNKLIKERQEQEDMRNNRLSSVEEEAYLEILNKIIQGKIDSGCRHPFRAVLEDFECYCRERGVLQN